MDALILGLRVLVALGAVLGLMWFLQRRLGKGTGRRRADRALTVVSRQSVGQKASVVVVDAAGPALPARRHRARRQCPAHRRHPGRSRRSRRFPAPAADRGIRPDPRRRSARFAAQQPASRPAGDGSDDLPTPASGTAAVPPQHPAPGLPCPRPRRPHASARRPPAAARLDPCRLHLEAGRRRSQERTPQLIRPLAHRLPPLPRQLPHDRSGSWQRCWARRRALRRAAAVAERLGRPRRPDRPHPAGRPDRSGQPGGGNVNIEINGLDGKPSTAVADPDRHHAALAWRPRCC